MKKCILLLTILLVAALVMSSCSQQADSTKTDNTPVESAGEQSGGTGVQSDNTAGGATEKVLDPPAKFTAITTYDIGLAAWGDDPISKKITELTNVELDLEYVSGDMNEKLGTMLASADYPEMILSVDNYQVADMLDAEAIVPLDPYLEKGGENIKKVFGDMLGAMKNPADGKIYGFNKGFGEMPTTRDWYVQVQYPVLKEAGYPKIETLDELGDLIEQYIAKHKTYNDIPLIGVLSPAGQGAIHQGIGNTAMRTAGFQDDGNYYIDPQTYNATYVLRTPEAKNYYKWLNKMYTKGLFSMDSFSLDHSGVSSEASKGHVLCVTSPQWAFKDVEKTLRTMSGTPELCYAKIPLYVSKEAAANSRVSNYDSLGTWKSVITKNCHDPERAFKFFDMMWSEEMQVLCWWGVEGELYTVSDGKRVLKEETIKRQQNDPEFRTQTGVSLYDYWSCGALVKDSTGQYINPYLTPESEALGYTDIDKEVLHAYNPQAVTWADLWPKPAQSPWGFAWKITLPKGEGAIAEKKVEDEIRGKYSYSLIAAKSEDAFEKTWDEFNKKMLAAGIEKREKEYTDAIKARMQNWHGK